MQRLLAGIAGAVVCLLAGCQKGAAGPAVAPVEAFTLGRPDVVLLISGGGNGLMEPCACPTPTPGGLASRSGLAASYRAALPGTVLIDLGDAMHVNPDNPVNARVLAGYKIAGYDVVTLGEQELAMSDDALTAATPAGLTHLSTTARPMHKPLSAKTQAVVYKQVGAAKLAFVSELTEDALRFFPENRRRQFDWTSRDELRKRIAGLKRDGCVVILVRHGAADEQADAMGADVILEGHGGRTAEQLSSLGGAYLAKVGGRETMGVLAMRVRDARVVAAEFRVEVLDDHWPLDPALVEMFRTFANGR